MTNEDLISNNSGYNYYNDSNMWNVCESYRETYSLVDELSDEDVYNVDENTNSSDSQILPYLCFDSNEAILFDDNSYILI